MKKHEELETPTYTTSIPDNIRPWGSATLIRADETWQHETLKEKKKLQKCPT